MDLNFAKKLLARKEEEKQQEVDAAKAVQAEEERIAEAKRQEMAEQKRREQEEFVAKIPSEFCKPVAKCWKCKSTVELKNDLVIKTVDGFYRISECPGCKSFVIDDAIPKVGATNVDALLPYCLKIKKYDI